MKLSFSVIFLSVCVVLFFNTCFSQDNSAYFTVGGEVLKPLKLSAKELSALKSSDVKAKDRDGKEHIFKGVMLWTVLDSAGVTLGKELRGENLAKYVLVKANDGYQVIFSLAEIDPEFSDKVILLAYEVDGKPLAATQGPFRLVVPQDKKHARWIRQLNSIQILFSKK
jgi:DMSO/TMAO reductase YedYZ molybdopterin-dependent catalytic subunit